VHTGIILLIAGILAFVLNMIFTPTILRLSHRFRWYDQIDHRKIHTEDTPRLGGVGFFLSFIFASIILAVFIPTLNGSVAEIRMLSNQNILLFVGLFMVHGLGLVDDFRNIRAIYKLIGLIIAGALVAIGGALMDGIYLPLIGFVIPLGPLSGAITIFWLISISNAVNLIDGLDGLAGGTGLIAAFAIGVVHIILGNFPGALYSIILAGALLAFLVFNRPKAKIFMGDSGSLFLGFLLGALVFIGGSDTSSMQQELNQFVAGFVLTITVLIVPIVDMISAILRRLRERKPIHHPDKEHLHHKLLGMGFSTVNILFLVHGVNLLMGLAVVSWAINKRFGGSDLAGDAILVLAWILGASLFTWLHYAYRSKK
jgi:UDP-GlcNAc:undecaprenyl-phosphate GlcNAc-1-phosphate transferase